MLLPIKAQAPALSDEDARILDDEFFRSDPNAYFRARIAGLLRDNRDAVDRPTPETDAAFFDALGIQPVGGALDFDDGDRKRQVAVDALALRQHVAESLVRFVHAVTAAKPTDGDARSTWMAVTQGPNQLKDVRNQIVAALDASQITLPEILFPAGTTQTPELHAAMMAASEWLNHALHLLLDDELAVNVAHNKLKHGLAVSARSNMRVELVRRANVNESSGDATVPLSAFGPGQSVPIFDRPFLTYLTRRKANPARGVEAVSIRVDVPVMLAEAWMMANVYGCLFNVAAVAHFGAGSEEEIAPYPTLVVGRTPDRVIGTGVLGTRANITLPADSKVPARPAGIFFHEQFVPISIDPTAHIQGRVVADD